MICPDWFTRLDPARTRAHVETNAWRFVGRAERHPTDRNRILAEVWQALAARLGPKEDS